MAVLCSRTVEQGAHVLGHVESEGGQLVLRYKGTMRIAFTGGDAQDFESFDAEYRPGSDAVGVDDAYCRSCKRRYFVPAEEILAAARRGARSFHLQGRNAEARLRHMPDVT
jgi:hypothetical protein